MANPVARIRAGSPQHIAREGLSSRFVPIHTFLRPEPGGELMAWILRRSNSSMVHRRNFPLSRYARDMPNLHGLVNT